MNRQHPSERNFDTPRESLAESLRCYCFSKSKSTTASTDNRIAVTDQGVVNKFDNVGADAKVAGGNITDLSGSRIGDDFTARDVTITDNSVETFTAALDRVSEFAEKQASGLTGALDQAQQKAENADKLPLLIAAGALAVAGYLLLKKR